MDIQMLTDFFMWCMIIGGGLYLFGAAWLMLLSDLTYRIHSSMLPLSRDQFNGAIYVAMGIFKIIVLVFAVVPYVALSIIS